MKKTGLYLLIMLSLISLFALTVETPMASQEQPKEAIQPVPTTHGESSHKGARKSEPIDSSTVIPKGPQWLGAPIMPDGTKVSEKEGRHVTEYNMPYNQVLAWYQDALKKYPDTRYRDWKEEMYIEDQGVSKWHSIKISKTGGSKTLVTIQKDNWTWIMATLFIRFVGVFVVLLVLWISLKIAILVMLKFVKEEKATQKPATAPSGNQ